MWIELFWEISGEPQPDLQLRFALRDIDGENWLDASQPANLPTLSEASESLLSRVNYGLEIPAGIPPGSYDLLLQPWDKSDDSQLAEWLHLATVEIASSDLWHSDIDWPFKKYGRLIFGDTLTLLGAVPAAQDVRPGHALPLSLYWQAGVGAATPADLRYQLDLVGPGGSILHTKTKTPGPAWLTPDEWPEEAVILEQAGLFIPADASPGQYQLRWRLMSGEETIPGRPPWRPWSGDSNHLRTITVTAWPLETTLPQEVPLVEVSFGSAIQLYAYDLESEQVSAGGALDLTLFWQALNTSDRSYHVFVHLVDSGNESIVAQSDRIPVDWLRPTNGWRPGEVLADKHRLVLPPDVAPGEYHLYVGFYDPNDATRLPVVISGKQDHEDRLQIQTIRVLP
jgi:hypothetical protein